MRLLKFLFGFPVLVFAQQDTNDVVLRAMKDEMARSRALRLVDAPPYFVEYTLDDADLYLAGASLGALIRERRSRLRAPRIRVRAGEPKLDNSNHIFSDVYRGARYDATEFPLDDHYDALRLAFWLATDRAYKQALEALARKKASLKNISESDRLPDFSPASVVSLILPVPKRSFDETKWRDRLRDISAVYRAYPDIFFSEVTLGISNTTSYLVNNEGTEVRMPDFLTTFRIRVSTMAPDGMPIRDYAEFLTTDVDQLPSESQLKKAAQETGDQVSARRAAPYPENYSGPVLFEGVAGPQLLAETLGRHFSPPRRPVSDPERPINFLPGELEGRLGSRILPEWMDVLDDPTQKTWRGTTLLGHYPVDIEGVPPKPVVLIEKGVLKSFLSTRQPLPGQEGSNGHARLPGPLGNNLAVAGNLFFRSSQVTAVSDLRKKLLDLCQQRGKAYAYVVRKMDFPSTASADELRRISSGLSGRPVSIPLRLYRLYPDGREEMVRGLRFRAFTTRALRDILAVSDELYLFQYLESGAPFAHMDVSGYVAGVSVVAPALLFDELELERIPGELPKPPVVSPPPLIP
ncbi:MAG: metallopeptidase TldD-related protein [Bryobacteraceae bacterium]|nr:metallopeptidase TldD-related protein [Bryobacteraceae bacterium]MDW8378543.1 metallopeptidase TldD-related protein [Bryobacterales bacterium]